MCCYVTSNEEREQSVVSTILREDQYFDSEADFCRVYDDAVLHVLERILLRNGISYFIKEENTSLLARLLCMRRSGFVVRINGRDMGKAIWLAEEIRGVEIIGELPEKDWIPREAGQRRKEEERERARFGSYRYDEREEERDYYERVQRSRQGA